VINLAGGSPELTSLDNGVAFDINGDGKPEQISWSVGGPANSDAWLVLDRNFNGRIDSGLELFGNFTQQKLPIVNKMINGFNALALFDTTGEGGNGDGRISASDQIFPRLALWIDANHDGKSTANELSDLNAHSIHSIDLSYTRTGRRDRNGNFYAYRSLVRRTGAGTLTAWDVYLRARPIS
jgi:hypothetical protein